MPSSASSPPAATAGRGTCVADVCGAARVLRMSGHWRLADIARLDAELAGAMAVFSADLAAPVSLDGARLDDIDTACALLVWHRLARAGFSPKDVALDAMDARHRRILDMVRDRLPADRAPLSPPAGLLADIGQGVFAAARLIGAHLSFLGLSVIALAAIVRRPSRLRVRELFAQLSQTCVSAIPVVSLVLFLIGVVVAYLLGLQAAQYGANIFVVDGVALGMVREFSPLLVAVIVAGRSGAAFTAQLGTMKLTEEVDAIRTLGLPPEQVLIVPRVLALCVALPVLVFVGNVLGMLGAAFVCAAMLDISPATFVDRVRDSLDVSHYAIGLGKAPVFALFIAVIGCSSGMTVSRDTRAIGASTTSTVVQCIVVVILLDAFFAVLFQALDL